MATHNYTQIEDTEENTQANNDQLSAMEMGDDSSKAGETKMKYRQPIQYAIIGVLTLAIVYFLNGYLTPSVIPPYCPACSFAQCEAASCDQISTPQVCTTGAAAGGCAATMDDWKGNSVCDACCDSSHCSAATPSGDDDTIELCPPCAKDECDTVASTCGLDAYMCLKGEAMGGCTTDKYHWPTAGKDVCGKCCDGAKC